MRTRLRSHSTRLTVVRRQKSNVLCVVTVLCSHKEVPRIDPFHVPLSRLVINFAGDTRFGLIAMVWSGLQQRGGNTEYSHPQYSWCSSPCPQVHKPTQPLISYPQFPLGRTDRSGRWPSQLGTCKCASLRASRGPNSLWHRQCSSGTFRRLECRPGPGIPCKQERSSVRVPYVRS